MDNEIKWNITSDERQGQVKQAVSMIGPTLLILIVYILLSSFRYYSLKEIVNIVLGVILIFLILLIINRFFPYKERAYSLDKDGLTVSRGRKTKRYSWSDFEYFCLYCIGGYGSYKNQYRYDITDDRKGMLEAEKLIEGNIFYLKKRPKNILAKLCKTFLVIYSEVNNSDTVLNFLKSHLPQQTMTVKTELGLIFYEFK